MNQQTFTKLVTLNNTFYEQIAQDFSDSRTMPWDGWQLLAPKLITQLHAKPKLRILDIGCGNGRFLKFLQTHFSSNQLEYYGVDSSAALLAEAHQNCDADSYASFIQSDILNGHMSVQLPPHLNGLSFDLVVAFGFFHHIPSELTRVSFLHQIESVLHHAGIAVITCWQFTNSQTLLNRKISPEKVGVSSQELELNDYILDWQRGTHAYRYCHLTTQAEMTHLLTFTNLVMTDFFMADGKKGNLNHYYLFEEKGQ